MIKYGFFNAKKLITGAYDRKYNAEDINRYFKGAISRDGIYQFVGNQCRVIPMSGMTIMVQDGKGQLDYHYFEITSNESITLNPSHATLNRWTAIIARYDATNRNIYITAIDGENAEKPSKPTMQRSDVIRDICLAYIYVAAGAIEITASDITDTIEDEEVCGYVITLLDSTASGVIKINTLPIPTAKLQGKIYYLTNTCELQGKTYEKGFYCTEPQSYNYSFNEFAFIADSFNNRPIANKNYIDIAFYAVDTDKWYRCVDNIDEYIWEEVVVSTVGTLPVASESTYNNFYLLDNVLYIGVRTGTNWTWSEIIKNYDNLGIRVDAIENKLKSATVVTIPISGWITETDANNKNYYTREIDVAGMTADYIGGNSKIDYVRPNPFSVEAKETILEMFQLIDDVEGMEGKIKVTASEIPTTAFQIYLYGV